MTRVIHTGDTHIGYRQYHSPERRADFLDAFERVVADAVDDDAEQSSASSRTQSGDDVDAVVHAGDLFHDRRPDLPDLLGVLSALRTLDDADIPFLAVVGNHESTRGGQWLDLFESMGLATRLDDEPTVIGDTAFYGLDHVPESRRDELDYEFAPHDADAAALVSHGLFEPFAYADWDTEELLERSTVDFDAVLLGDNHTPDTAQVSGTWVTYCGSTERASASERDPRGYNLVRLGADAEAGDDAVDIRRRALETRPFVFVDVELADGEGLDRVRDRVRERDVEDAVVIVRVTGDGEPIAPAAVEEFAAERGALIARVTDRREVEAETELSVSFADPDEAVRERIGELDLSEAAREVDDVVRGDLPDSNVREEAKRRIENRLDGGDAADGADDGAAADEAGGDDGAQPDDAAATDDEAAADDGTVADDATGGDGDAAEEGPPPADAEGDDGQLTLGDSQ
ncbi:DNA double-strand break repair protein Mre11 [Halobaculum magnesiiphilum]|uniref:DNA double-strand break repair protein Mre11 n=1 Tax=Halobaculum magnesiiphilum TaxID=1017351 RepID=A0A8T8WC54_9EURY|nr:DNA double-strand break repair protein Mre11 [Halobaculum magnesiiphilum]QZP37333.1 exonuclease SbcCD subunit D [Halobaculum magnesiiphilum]